MGRETSARELRSIAPLVVLDGKPPKLVGACTLVTNGTKTIAFSSSELLRLAGEPLAVATKLDGSQTIPVASWSVGKNAGIGIIELGPLASGFTPDPKLDITPIPLANVHATINTHNAPSALVTIVQGEKCFERRVIPVHVDAIDGGGMVDEVISRLASPIAVADADISVDGSSALFAWLPADPVLGRKSEVVVVALGIAYRRKMFKPRALPALAELVGLDDLGRALPWSAEKEASNELGQIAGEIRDDLSGPLAGLDFDKD